MTDQAPIARVVAVTGEVYVRNENGEMRLLAPDSVIYPGERIVADPGESVELAMANGQSMLVDAQTPVTFSNDMLPETANNADDAALESGSIDELLKALENGEEVDDLLEAPAAGAGGDDGHSFVILERIAETIEQQGQAGVNDVAEAVDLDLLDVGSDQQVASELGTQINNVADVNDAPTAVQDGPINTDEDVAVDINVVSNDTDLDGSIDPSTVAIVGTPSNGTVSVNPTTGLVTFTPAANFVGEGSFTYTVQDDDGATSNPITVTVNVADVNDAPTAVQDGPINTDEDVAVDINVVSNDTDLDGSIDPSTVAIVGTPSNGMVSVNPTTGLVTFTPAANFVGEGSFTYTVQDDDGATSNPITVTVNVADVNDAPTAVQDGPINTDEDVAVDINVVSNDTDLDGSIDPSTVAIVGTPSNGTVSVNPTTGLVTFTPAANFVGEGSFTYTVQDDDGATSNPITVTVNVADVNDAPTAVQDGPINTDEDVAVDINVVSNDTDLDGSIDPSTVAIVGTPSNGTVSVNPTTGLVTFTPAANFVGEGSFTYTVQDDDGATSNPITVTVNVADVNDAPTAVQDGPINTDEDVAVDINVVSNDTDLDGSIDPSTVAIVGTPSNGMVSVNPTTGLVTFTPAANFVGEGSFTYTVQDDDGATSNPITVTVNVADVNDAPTAVQDGPINTDEDVAVDINVVSNDTDLDGSIDPSTVAIVGTPSNGTVSVNPTTGLVTFTPAANFVGEGSFTYTVQDDDGATSNPITVTVNVADVNDAPTAVQDGPINTDEDVAVDINVVSNDTDLDGSIDPSTVAIVGTPSNGMVSVNPTTGLVTFTPAANFVGEGSFTYTVQDDDGATSNPITVTVNVADVNDAPTAVQDGPINTDEDVAVDINVVSNDTDLDGSIDPSTVAIVGTPSNGTVSVNPTTGLVTFTPATNFVGEGSFTYTVQDDDGATSNPITVTVNVADVNDAPTAVQDGPINTDEDVAVDINVVSNDTDLDGSIDPSTVAIVGTPSNGTVSVNPTTGLVTFTPAANFVGEGSFTYTVQDDDGATSNPITVTVNVADVNDAPTAVQDGPINTDEDVAVDINVVSNDTDLDGSIDPSTVAIVGTPSNGMVSVNPTTGLVTFTPAANFVGEGSFTYTVQDDDGATSNPITVTVNVADVNDAPTAVQDGPINTDEDVAVDINVVSNDTDLDGSIDPSTVAIVGTPSNGMVSVNPTTGLVTFTPAANFVGEGSFTYTVQDDDGATSNPITVTVNVADVNDAPVAVDDTITVDEDAVFVSTIDLDSNDFDDDGDALSVVAGTFATAQGGSIVIATDGSYTYTPKGNFSGSDSVDYTVTDGALTDTGTLNITVNPVADDPVISQATATPPTSTGLNFSFYEDLNNTNRDASSQEAATSTTTATSEVRQLTGFGTTEIVTSGDFKDDGSTIEIKEDDAYSVTGLIYLTAGNTYQFSGYHDDSMRIELGGQTLISSTGDSFGNYGQGTSTFNGAGNIFTAPEDGYYTLEVYVNNVSGPGQFSLNINVNGAPAKELDATNFSIYSDVTDLAAVGGQFSNFVGSGINAGGGYFPASSNTGITDSLISIDNLSVTLTDTDGSEVIQSVVIKSIPVGAMLISGANSFTATAGNTQVDVTTWSLADLHVLPPAGFTGTFDLDITATSQETANNDTATSNETITVNVVDFNTATAGIDTDLLGDGNIIRGTSGDDVLSTTGTSRIVDGDAGNDTITGGSGIDLLVGGLGDDVLTGKNGDDLLYGNAGNDNLSGGSGSDFLAGGTGNDDLSGGSGNDMLYGGEGNDTLAGGGGVDTFAWELGDQGTAGTPAVDTISDFNNGANHDVLDLRDLLVDEQNHDLTDYLHVRESGGDTFIDVSSNGQFAAGFDASKVDQTIELSGVDFGSVADQSALLQNLVDSGKLITD